VSVAPGSAAVGADLQLQTQLQTIGERPLAVPEPATIASLVAGGALLAALARHPLRRRAVASAFAVDGGSGGS
jgi:hypothetical protein